MTNEERHIAVLNRMLESMDVYDSIQPTTERKKAIKAAIKALEQEPKTGHWIFQDITQGKRMWCSNCNSAFDLCCNQIKRYDEATKKEYLWGHCPWCGARMVEPQERSDKE